MMGNKINDESKRRVYTRTTDTWYLVLRLIPGGSLCGSKESTGLRSAGGWRRPLRSRKEECN